MKKDINFHREIVTFEHKYEKGLDSPKIERSQLINEDICSFKIFCGEKKLKMAIKVLGPEARMEV